jgi:hypothetical protein
VAYCLKFLNLFVLEVIAGVRNQVSHQQAASFFLIKFNSIHVSKDRIIYPGLIGDFWLYDKQKATEK